MLGDNTQDSADGRLWKAMTYSYGLPGGKAVKVRGNFRTGGDRPASERDGSENPVSGRLSDGKPAIRFRDQWGEIHWFTQADVSDETLPGGEPLVPRELIIGRALAVFWPIRPTERLWRIGWLH